MHAHKTKSDQEVPEMVLQLRDYYEREQSLITQSLITQSLITQSLITQSLITQSLITQSLSHVTQSSVSKTKLFFPRVFCFFLLSFGH
jgi:hypothetical protein